jgi:L-alanine-DL-glutamate epimerase-like enolase superfamily enzyme
MSSRIKAVRTQCASWELEEPQYLRGTEILCQYYDNIIIHVDTEDGVTGTSYVWTTGGRDDHEPPLTSAPGMIQLNVEALAPAVIGEDVFSTSKLWAKVQLFRVRGARHGLAAIAHAGIDMAMWDAMCKLSGQPLYKMLGACRTDVPVYNAEMFELANSGTAEQYVAKALDIKSRGFKAIKMYYGTVSEEAELERIGAVREAVGPDFGLMVDVAAHGAGLPQTLKFCRNLEQFNLIWIEDPFEEDDLDLHRQLAAEIDTPIMMGERRGGVPDALELLKNHCTDILSIEPMKYGGITGTMRAAAIAEAYGIPIAVHANPEVGAHFMASIPNGLFMEYMPWWSDPLMETTLTLNEDGTASPSEIPGVGYTFKENVTEKPFVYLGKWNLATVS